VRRSASVKTPPDIYRDPHFAEQQREAWEQRRAIVRHFSDADIRIR
jgi:hypothetical protein